MSYTIFTHQGTSSSVFVPKQPQKGKTCTIKGAQVAIRHVKNFPCGSNVIMLQSGEIIILPGKVLKEMSLDKVYLLTAAEYRAARKSVNPNIAGIEFFKKIYPRFPKTAELVVPHAITS